MYTVLLAVRRRAVLLQRALVMAASCTDAVKPIARYLLITNNQLLILAPDSKSTCLACAVREMPTDTVMYVGVLTLHYQVASDSLCGATSNSKISTLAYYRHAHYILTVMCAKIV